METTPSTVPLAPAGRDSGEAEPFGPTRRERKKLQTRDALEASALRLFAEKGYEATTIEEIAESADVAVRTFFRYFQSKRHVLFGDVAHDVTERLRAALAGCPSDEDPVAAVGAALAGLDLGGGDGRRQIRDRMRLVERVPELGGAYHLLFQELHDTVAEFVAARTGSLPHHMHPQLVAAAATAAIRVALVVAEAQPGGPGITEIGSDAYRRLTAGLITGPLD